MKRQKTHVCLVSQQATPNLAPALDRTLAPTHILLVVSADMKQRADWLEGVLKRHGLATTRLAIANAYDYHAISEQITDWLAQREDEDIALNITGGTKVMAIAAQEAFRLAEKPIYYINQEDDSVLWLHDRNVTTHLEKKIRLRDFLEVHGYAIEGRPEKPEIPANRRDLVSQLVQDVRAFGSALGDLNGLAQAAKKTLRSPPLDERQLANRSLGDLIYLFESENLLSRQDKCLYFPDEPARQFVNGGWLEFHVYRILSDLAPSLGISDYATNLRVTAPNGKTANEIDVAFLLNNRLNLIECKAANLSLPGSTGQDKGADAIYKLETLLKLGGLRTRGMLIDYRARLTNVERDRAKQSGIYVASGTSLQTLSNEIRLWLR